jgi:hypothetical protein
MRILSPDEVKGTPTAAVRLKNGQVKRFIIDMLCVFAGKNKRAEPPWMIMRVLVNVGGMNSVDIKRE